MFVDYSADELHAEAEYDWCYAESRELLESESNSSESESEEDTGPPENEGASSDEEMDF